MIRLSLMAPEGDPDPLQTARIRMRRIHQALGRKGIQSGEWSWTLEHNPLDSGYHAHVLQHGPFLDQGLLQVACHKAGAGIPYINAIKRTPGKSARYGMKGFGADGYGLKKFRAEGDAQLALRINGDRLEHHTRAFFRINGNAAPLKEVERAAIAEQFPAQAADYIVCSRAELLRYLTPGGLVALARQATHHVGVLPF